MLWGPEHAHGPSASNLQRLPRMVGPLGPLTWGSSSSAVETDSRSGAVNSLSLHPMLPPARSVGRILLPRCCVCRLEFNCGGRRRQEGQLPKSLTREAHNWLQNLEILRDKVYRKFLITPGSFVTPRSSNTSCGCSSLWDPGNPT